MTKPSDFPYFPGKELAIEVRDRGIKVIGLTDDIKEAMLIGLIQVVEELRDEIKWLKEQSCAAEREACAKVCDDKNTLLAWPTYAAAIRARGQA